MVKMNQFLLEPVLDIEINSIVVYAELLKTYIDLKS